MTEAAKKETKPKGAKAPAAKKEAAPAAAKKEAVPKKPAHTGGKVKVTQVVGSIAREHSQRSTLIGLGLNKRHRSRVLIDTPEVRGMIRKVQHLVKVEQA
jgi:large subunit ribosomal protein L30